MAVPGLWASTAWKQQINSPYLREKGQPSASEGQELIDRFCSYLCSYKNSRSHSEHLSGKPSILPPAARITTTIIHYYISFSSYPLIIPHFLLWDSFPNKLPTPSPCLKFDFEGNQTKILGILIAHKQNFKNAFWEISWRISD